MLPNIRNEMLVAIRNAVDRSNSLSITETLENSFADGTI
jgi:hypothetical protein